MKIIDVENWDRKTSYEWFSKFSNPTYALSVKLDITPLIALKQENGRSFFEDMLYLCVKGLNEVPALRLRLKGGTVVEYDAPDPSFTVAKEGGLFDICRVPWSENAYEFCRETRRLLEITKNFKGNKGFGNGGVDVYYFTCLPWLYFDTMTNPIPDDPEIASIPRICWGKFVREGERYLLPFSIQVSHALVDGKPLSNAFAAVQGCVDNCAKLLLK